ncbi:hypothetical protein J6590_094924, partial [Homalodisca vitripennis]
MQQRIHRVSAATPPDNPTHHSVSRGMSLLVAMRRSSQSPVVGDSDGEFTHSRWQHKFG